MAIQAPDIRDTLRKDHDTALAELEALRHETEEHRCKAQLFRLRQAWIIHALAEESVVYRALEGAEAAAGSPHPSDERFIEHELIGGLFDKLMLLRRGTLEWDARVRVIGELIARHSEKEHRDMFARLGARFGREELVEMGQRFELARDKLAMLEEAKAA